MNNEQPKNDSEVTQENTVESEVKNDPFAKGRERIASIGNFFTKSREKVVALTNRVGSGLSNFWSRTKKFSGEAIAATLSADVLAKQADAYVGQKSEQAGTAVGNKLAEAGDFVSEKVTDASEFVSDKATQAKEWVGERAGEVKDWTNDQVVAAGAKINQFDDFLARKAGEGAESLANTFEKSSEWINNKADRVKEITTEGIEIAKDVAFAVKEKTIEGFQTAKEGIKNQYNNTVEFGQNALAAVKIEAAKIKDDFRGKKNAFFRYMDDLRATRLKTRTEKREIKNERDRQELAQLEAKRRSEFEEKVTLFGSKIST